MINRILVAIDHSEHSTRATALATELAVKFGAPVTFVHVLDKVLGREQLKRYVAYLESTPHPNPVQVEGIHKELAQSGEAEGIELLGVAKSTALSAGVEEVDTTLLDGDPATVILHHASQGEYDAIVLGRRGMGSLKGLLTGSVSQKVASWGKHTIILVN